MIHHVRWPWQRSATPRPRANISISDPRLTYLLNGSGPLVDAGVHVHEGSALGLSAMWRAVSLVGGTLGMLPMPTMRDTADGMTQQMRSVFDAPGGRWGPTAHEWKETLVAHVMLHGFSLHVHRYNAAGGLIALEAIHPLSVGIERWRPDDDERPPGDLWFRVTLDDGTSVRLTQRSCLYIPALSMDGKQGIGLLAAARQSLGTTIAGDRAAGKAFGQGVMVRGMLTPEDELEPGEADEIGADVNQEIAGWERAAAVKVINRKLKFSPWTMNLADMQFLQSREFQIEEIARWTGIPPFALMQTTKQTSWGTGIAEQQRGLSRTVLAPLASRIEQRCTRVLAPPSNTLTNPLYTRFDFGQLERPNPEAEDTMLLAQVAAGVLTKDEYRARRGLPPLPEAEPAGPAPVDDPEEVPA